MNEYKQNDASEPERYTLAYRAAETRQVMNWVKAGLSGCLIGLRGVGKSNFLQFLFCPEVRRHYLGQGYADFVFVHLDLLTLTECTEWAVYELILDRLRDQLCPPDIGAEIAAEVAMLHQEVIRTRDPFVAQRAVEQCVMVLCQNSMQHFVLLFDEFDAVFQTLAPFLFCGLRAIRDAHKDRVSYIVDCKARTSILAMNLRTALDDRRLRRCCRRLRSSKAIGGNHENYHLFPAFGPHQSGYHGAVGRMADFPQTCCRRAGRRVCTASPRRDVFDTCKFYGVACCVAHCGPL